MRISLRNTPNEQYGQKSSLRFRAGMWLNSEVVAQRPEVVGWENLEKIPKGINPVIAGSHLRSDASIQIIAREFSEKFNIGIAVQSANRKNPITNALMTLAGQDNFYDIDNTTERKTINGKRVRIDKYTFNQDNYDAMRNAMEKGKTLIISAHYSPIYNGVLPHKPGFAVIYLAYLSGQRVILPVALEMYTDDEDTGRIDRLLNLAKKLFTRNRPKTKMTICKPITLAPIDSASIELMTKWLIARVNNKLSTFDPKQQEQAMRTYKNMRDEGKKVMHALAKALPETRRGIWNKKSSILQS